ncbi:MAG: type II toxin-antitoxin system RelE/ParE family toxin [Alphaproteobacteria bacterium]|nr:type II toxin-antitoxin system RelE/ParE family toxin [Alphaproteobacteria bacterium]
MTAVLFLPRARSQLKDIHARIALGDAIMARAFILRVEEAADTLARDPEAGRPVPRRDLRRFPLTPYPYSLYYKLDGGEVRVLSVLSDAGTVPRFHEPVQAFAR